MTRALVLLALALAPRLARADDEGAAMGRALQALLRANAADIRACVGANDRPGEALLDVVAGRDRKVLAARVLKSDPPVAAAARCVAERAQKWSLAALDVSEGDQLVLPLVFRPDPKPEIRVVEVVKDLDLSDGLFAIYLDTAATLEIRGKRQPLGAGRGAIVGIPATLRCPQKCSALVVKLPHTTEFLGAHTWSFNALPVYPLPGKRGSVQLGTDNVPSIPLAYDWLEVAPNVELPVHTHEGSTEVVYVVSGKGTMTLAGKPIPVETGRAYEIPVGVAHGLRSDTAITAVQLYLPRGPEQRFKPAPTP